MYFVFYDFFVVSSDVFYVLGCCWGSRWFWFFDSFGGSLFVIYVFFGFIDGKFVFYLNNFFVVCLRNECGGMVRVWDIFVCLFGLVKSG